MLKSLLVCCALILFVIGASQAQQPTDGKTSRVILTWLGTAGWQITDGTTVILIDPYISRIFGPQPPGRAPYTRAAADTRPEYGWKDVATPDGAAIDAHIQRADFVLVTHTHYDHVLDVPTIAKLGYCTSFSSLANGWR